MVRLRSAKYCNMKLVLIFLVVFGHLIEPMGHWLYRAIYAFHMPAFAMLSGLFSGNKRTAMVQRLLLWYTAMQTVAVVLGKTSILTPYWHLWYLLSDVFWILMSQWSERFDSRLVLCAAIFFGCLVGYIPYIGRVLSLSRSVVFFPYYLYGRFWAKARNPRKICDVAVLIISIFGFIFIKIPTDFLYQATSYGKVNFGGLLRLVCYGIGFSCCWFLLDFTPKRRFSFTKLGNDTLTVYLFHAPIVLLLRKCGFSLLLCAILSVMIIWVFYKFGQGSRYFCARKEELVASFQKIYEQYATSVYRFLLSLSADETLSEELLQETFYRALVHIDRFEGRCSIFTWLCQIGKNAWLHELRRSKKYVKTEISEISSEMNMEEKLADAELSSHIRRVMMTLPEPYRDVFIMHALGGVKLKEIASLYDKSESWARVTYFRAKQQILKEVMK